MTLELLNPKDTSTVREIMNRTCDILRGKPLRLGEPPRIITTAFSDGERRFDLLGAAPLCIQASDAVTRAAQSMGIVASREMHARDRNTIPCHYLTSFGPLDRPPSPDDPILCATWGQFSYTAFKKRLGKKDDLYGFFAKRRDIERSLRFRYTYNYDFGVGSVALRQITHAALTPEIEAADPGYFGHLWLDTTPDDILNGQYPFGEVAVSDFSAEEWEYKALVRKVMSNDPSSAG